MLRASSFPVRHSVLSVTAASVRVSVLPGETVTPPAVPEESGKQRIESDSLSGKLRRILKKESERNRIGVSLTFLKRLCGNPKDEELLRILTDAPWAEKQYGMYRYTEAGDSEEPPAPPVCEQIPMIAGQLTAPLGPSAPENHDDSVPRRSAGSASKPGRGEEDDGCVQLAMEIPEDGREELRVGTVLKTKGKKRAKNAWASVDFGADFGKADARIPASHLPRDLSGKQVVCAVRFENGKRSVRVQCAETERGAVTIAPAEILRNGDRVE